MANTRLEIGSNTNVGYFDDIPVTIIFQISDIREPDKKMGSYSKSISIPASQETNILFENIFEANISLSSFNPHLKTSAKYYVDEVLQFKGYAKLQSISLNETTGNITYNLNLIGDILTLFTEINSKYLTDLDFSAYDHTLDFSNISTSWLLTPGSGYVYPMIDWGVNQSDLTQVKPEHLRACLFVREYMLKIFTAAGYTWTSAFLDSAYFKNLIIPPAGTLYARQVDLDANKFLAVANGSQTQTITFTSTVGNNILYASQTLNDVAFQSETYDVSNLFVTPNFTPAVSSTYNLTAKIALNFVVKRNGVDVSANIAGNSSGIHVIIYNTTTSSITGLYDLNAANCSFAAANQNNTVVNLNGVPLTAGNVYKVVIKYAAISLQWNAATAGATWTMETKIVSGSNFAAELSSPNLYEGGYVAANNLIPVGVRQTDFISSLFKMFNLYCMVDKNNPKNLIIEDRESFYSTNAIDWTYKHDQNSMTEIIPLGELNNRVYQYSYKSDGDFYNADYYAIYKNLDASQQVYGSEEYQITDDFIKNVNKTEVIFSATPYNINVATDMVIPTIIKKENNIVSEFKPNIRILYWGGMISQPGINWKLVYNAGANTQQYFQMPAAGHTDNPYNPTLDINWGIAKKVYYTYPNLQWTNNNLYMRFYSRYINQISDKGSKIVKTDFWLTPIDINTFDFRVPIFWKDAYYLVNNFEYNPVTLGVTKVELLKLTNYDNFVPSVVDIGSLGTGNVAMEMIGSGNIGTGTGQGNYNMGNNSAIIGGSGNFIANG